MATAITARRAVDYQIASGLVLILILVAIVVPPFGTLDHWGLSVTGVAFTALVMARPLGARLRFTEHEIAYVNVFGRALGTWPLDGTSIVSVDPVVTQSRWGRAVRGALVLKGLNGLALALTKGRYTRERAWSTFLLDQYDLGRVMLTLDAQAALRANAGMDNGPDGRSG